MIEHIPIRQQPQMFFEFFRVLKPGGTIKLMTIDFSDLAETWLNEIKDKPLDINSFINIAEVIYGNQVADGEFHKCPYTPSFLGSLLKGVGFTDIVISIYPRFNTDVPDLAYFKEFPLQGSWRSAMLVATAVKPKIT